MKRIVILLLVICLALALWGCAKGEEAPVSTAPTGEYASGIHHAKIVIKNYGTITVELDADTAPISVANFCKLAKEGAYNGTTFHRIISGFMMQGGAVEGAAAIKGEFAANGVKNDIKHVRGVISMARAKSYDSGSSQFFIMQGDASYLDGNYAAFGRVTSGMEIVDLICENTPVTDNNGTVAKENQPVIETVQVLD